MLRDERRGPVPQPERGRLAGVALTDLTLLLEDAFGRLEPPRQVQPGRRGVPTQRVVAHRSGALRLSSPDAAHILINALRALDGADMSPASLTVRDPSLDDVFLSLTGRHAEEDGGAEASEATGGRRRR